MKTICHLVDKGSKPDALYQSADRYLSCYLHETSVFDARVLAMVKDILVTLGIAFITARLRVVLIG